MLLLLFFLFFFFYIITNLDFVKWTTVTVRKYTISHLTHINTYKFLTI